MFIVDYNYLKLCGITLSNDKVSLVVDKDNSFFPKLSCSIIEGKYIFTLHYSKGEAFLKSSLSFSYDEFLGGDVYSSLPKEFFNFFSLSESFLVKVRSSILNGKKSWKIRRFPLPLKKAHCIKELGGISVSKKVKESSKKKVKEVDECNEIALYNFDISIKRAAQDHSYQAFEYFYQAWKDLNKPGGKSAAWNYFLEHVRKIQKAG